MHLGVECLRNHHICLVSGLALNMKKQLNDCKLAKKKNFGYPNILTTFFFERVSSLSPKVTLPHPHPHESRLTRWVDVLVRQGGGGIQGGYDDDFHSWWSQKVPPFEPFPYVGLGFRGDP